MYKVLGVSDDKDFCECCGKKGLKKVVFIENMETSEIKHFGTTCAKSPQKGFFLDMEIKSAIRDFEFKQECVRRKAFSLYKKNGGLFTYNKETGAFSANDKILLDKCYEFAT